MRDFSNVKKACGFYVSSMHLITMILPYVKNELKGNSKIETILEYNLKENVKKVITNLIIDNKEKENILNINWDSQKVQKYCTIEKRLKKLIENNNKLNILISGKIEYIEETNLILDRFLNKNFNKLYNKHIKIINLYEVTEFDDNIREIIDKHELLINTSGMHNIEEIFEDYKKEKIN